MDVEKHIQELTKAQSQTKMEQGTLSKKLDAVMEGIQSLTTGQSGDKGPLLNKSRKERPEGAVMTPPSEEQRSGSLWAHPSETGAIPRDLTE